jgi:hypothetical protein
MQQEHKKQLKQKEEHNSRKVINNKIYPFKKKPNRPLFAQQQQEYTSKAGPKMKKSKNTSATLNV